jgi:hypothetical protein
MELGTGHVNSQGIGDRCRTVPQQPPHGEHLLVHACDDTALCMETSLSVQKCRI